MIIKTSWIVKKFKKQAWKTYLPWGNLTMWKYKIENYSPSLPYVLIYSHNRNKDSSCPTCQSDKGNDNVEDFRRTPYLTIEVSLFSTAYKKAGSKTQAIAITNRLLPVSSPLFTTEIMRRFDAMINVEQMIKKDFLFI